MKDLRLRRAAQALFAALALLFALTACDHGWIGDARLVNRRTGTTDDDSSSSVGGAGSEAEGEEKEPEEGVGSGEGEGGTTTTTDPFEMDAEWNSINYVFDGNKFDNTWVLKTASFDSDNIPTYGFSSGSWTLNNSDTCEYYYSVPNGTNTAQGYNISSMKTYQYKGKNPKYSYNNETRIERFRFYRMTGSAASLMSLDQYLIAVDTYSKFVFAYAKVSSTKTINLIIIKIEYPTGYTAVESYGDYYFYQYDPIGYVEDDGNVVLYQQYKDDMAAGNDGLTYMPSIHEGYTEIAKRNSNGEGRSPYYPGLYE